MIHNALKQMLGRCTSAQVFMLFSFTHINAVLSAAWFLYTILNVFCHKLTKLVIIAYKQLQSVPSHRIRKYASLISEDVPELVKNDPPPSATVTSSAILWIIVSLLLLTGLELPRNDKLWGWQMFKHHAVLSLTFTSPPSSSPSLPCFLPQSIHSHLSLEWKAIRQSGTWEIV